VGYSSSEKVRHQTHLRRANNLKVETFCSGSVSKSVSYAGYAQTSPEKQQIVAVKNGTSRTYRMVRGRLKYSGKPDFRGIEETSKTCYGQEKGSH